MNPSLETLLNKVSKSAVLDQGDLKAAATLVLESVMQGLNVQRCGIWLFQESLSGISCYLLFDTFTGSTVEDLVLNRKDYPKYFEALEEARTIAADDAGQHPATFEFKENYLDVLGITSMLDTPIRHSGDTVGIICSEHRGEVRQWSDDEKVFAGVLSDLFGRAISASEKFGYEQKLIETNKSLEEKVAKRTKHLEQTIEEMKTLQSQLIESEKMASLGNMVAGIAHEVNTPLGIALTASSHLKDGLNKLDKDFSQNAITKDGLRNFLSTSGDAVNLVENNLSRAATLISNFKRTSADQNHFEFEDINLKTYIQKTLTTLVPITKKKKVLIDIEGDDVNKTTLPGAIAQIITNLVSNSCIHGFANMTEQPKILIQINEVKDKVQLIFKDNGCGMSDEQKQKAFDPFYTTKRGQGGTGLGLSIVYTLVTQNLNGKISLLPSEKNGLGFELIF
ncbi:GAF domain-containing sensor histidine kinase [Oceaniserpentilla sp. 4NH20-0058]|uniref:sensor histidine kinase n=1 Tax=Oceaniserpentilla sp. 4NH20-0058 TaxID=3127660 RepID=UPI003102CD38